MARKQQARNFAQLLAVLKSMPAGDLRPSFQGFAYRFVIFLPLLDRQGKEVFRAEQILSLTTLFHDRFEGFSATATEGNPPWYGSWYPAGAEEPMIDRHVQFVIYTPQTEAAKTFFGYLRGILRRPDVAQQQIVVIEHSSVWLVPALEMPEA